MPFAIGKVQRDAAFRPRRQQVLQPDVGKRAAHHHAIVAAPRAEGIEVLLGHAVLNQKAAGGPVHGNIARGRDVVGGHGIAQQRQHARAVDFADGPGRGSEADEERRLLNVSRGVLPWVKRAAGHGNGIPSGVAVPGILVTLAEHLRADGAAQGFTHFRLRRPDVAQVDGVALAVFAQRFGGQVDIHGARQRVSHHQRRRRQVIRAHLGMHAALKIAIAGKHRRGHQLALGHRARHFRRQRPAVADARGAAITHQVEVQTGERLEQSRLPANIPSPLSSRARGWF